MGQGNGPFFNLQDVRMNSEIPKNYKQIYDPIYGFIRLTPVE